MSQHSFAENATITHLSHSVPCLFLSAGMSVKDKLSEDLTEIEFHTSAANLNNMALLTGKSLYYSFTPDKKIYFRDKMKFSRHIKINHLPHDSPSLKELTRLTQKVRFRISRHATLLPKFIPACKHQQEVISLTGSVSISGGVKLTHPQGTGL